MDHKTVKTFVIVPVYNEQTTLEGVLGRMDSLGVGPGARIEQVVLVDDGSSDGSGAQIDQWVKKHPGYVGLHHAVNQGYSQALLTGFDYLRQRLISHEVSPDDVVATVDADGQHDPLELPRLLDIMENERLDVLWAQRDFTLYPFIKRFGNRVMSKMSQLFSGHPFRDVESGYCIFRLGPLAHALRLRSHDWRYSISLTLAVILARLGYKISNEPMVDIPLYRSRTRILDVFTDTLAAANGFLDVQRETFIPRRGPAASASGDWERRREKSDYQRAWLFLAIGSPVWTAVAVMCIFIVAKSIYLGYDSINNYAHVWFIANSWQAGSMPLRNPWMEGGEALTFPYGFFPWSLAALLYPIGGDYAVTWVGVLGFLLLLLVVWWTRLHAKPWLFTLFLLFPPVTEALLSFQVAFIWGCLFAFLYVRSIEAQRGLQAPFWLFLAVSSHILILGPMLLLYDAYVFVFWRKRRKEVLKAGLITLPGLLLVAWYTVKTPSIGFYTPLFLFVTTAITFLPRFALFGLPFLLAAKKCFFSRPKWAVGTAAAFLALYMAQLIPFHSFPGLVARADNVYSGYLDNSAFVPGAHYRLLESGAREQGHYFFMQRGGVLTQELFSESQLRRNWSMPGYRCILTSKGIDYVVVNRGFTPEFRTNEVELLKTMVDLTLARVSYADPQGQFVVYDVRTARDRQRLSIRECAGL